MSIRIKYLTTNQAAERLGVGRFTIYRWIKSGQLQAVRFGPRIIKFRETDILKIEEGFRQQEAEAAPEPVQKAPASNGSISEDILKTTSVRSPSKNLEAVKALLTPEEWEDLLEEACAERLKSMEGQLVENIRQTMDVQMIKDVQRMKRSFGRLYGHFSSVMRIWGIENPRENDKGKEA